MVRTKTETALLVIDCQNYFLDPKSPAYLQGSRAMVPAVNRLARVFADAGRPVIFTAHRAPYKSGNLMSKRYDRLPRGRECGLWKKIQRPPKSLLIEKEHYSAFQGTGLAGRLARLGVGEIFLCGVMTHLCVDTTARHGFMLGFQPVIAGDACCSKSPAYHRAALLALKHGFADIVTAREAIGRAGKNV